MRDICFLVMEQKLPVTIYICGSLKSRVSDDLLISETLAITQCSVSGAIIHILNLNKSSGSITH